MNFTDIPRGVLRLQYRIARLPLQLIERRIATMDPEAPARLLYERSFGAIDTAVGKALGDEELAQRGDALVERSEVRAKAARLDADAAQTKKLAVDELRKKRESAAAAAQKAHASSVERTEQVQADAAKDKQQAARNAAKRTTAAKQKVDEEAARRTEAADAAKRDQERVIAAREESAKAVADAGLEDAAAKRNDAVAKQLHADGVEGLADAEKAERRQAKVQG
jgi:hypothetical protein